MNSKGHIHLISLVMLVLALIGAYQVYRWHEENVLKEKAYQTFNQVNEKVREALKERGYPLDRYDRQIRDLLERYNTPEELKMLSSFLERAYLGNDNGQIGIVKGK